MFKIPIYMCLPHTCMYRPVRRSFYLERKQHLHRGDVLEKVLDDPTGVHGSPGTWIGQQWKVLAVV